ncbi:hypothetical protein X749_14965 [Mesorhizobium sp. LNJC391B00]|nr:hypothetical protein X749_14965 [Mesorhizobium sp. LNJC391B00]
MPGAEAVHHIRSAVPMPFFAAAAFLPNGLAPIFGSVIAKDRTS